jgi:hypothetical protein
MLDKVPTNSRGILVSLLASYILYVTGFDGVP